jgi:L-alanine-DL-glutamate epimerase-like enolase superfamily enzyme
MNATDIVSLEADPIDIPLIEPFAIAGGAPSVAANVVVQVRLADGTLGLGEAAPFEAVSGETQSGSVDAIQAAASWLEGRDARGWRPLAARLKAELPNEPAARCAIEVALLDALTRHHRMPLWSFFGGAGTEVDTDMTITAGDREQAVASARAIHARGIQSIKVKIGTRSPEEDADRLRAVHLAVPRAKLTADANGGYSVAQAVQFLESVQALKVPLDLFEQPVDPDDWLELMRNKPSSSVVICADESARSASDVLALIRAQALQAVNIKPMKTGVVESIDIWSIARAAGTRLMIGGMIESPLAMSFSVHLAAGLGGFSDVDLDTPMFMKEHPFTGGFQQNGSRLSVAHVEAGHGVSMAETTGA